MNRRDQGLEFGGDPPLPFPFDVARKQPQPLDGVETIPGASQSIQSGRYRLRLAKGFEGRLQVLVNQVGVDLRGG